MNDFLKVFISVSVVLVVWHFLAAFIPGIAAFVRV